MDSQTLLNHLSRHKPNLISDNSRYAAVAIMLLLKTQTPQLFLIKRTEHPNDPWSGQIGLPGGHHESHDSDLIQTAIRETREETGIKIDQSHYVTQVNDQQGYAQGGKINLTVSPFVFLLDDEPDVFINHELEHYFWIPFDHFQTDAHHIYFNPMESISNRPGVRLDDANVLWGMTYRILSDFFDAAKIESQFVGDYDQSR